MTNTRRLVLAVALASLMLLAPISGVVGTAGFGDPAPEQTSTNGIDEGQLVDVTENVAVWERTPLSLRADTDDGDIVVDNLNLQVQTPDLGPAGMDRHELAVFETDSDVTLAFGESDNADTSQIAGEDVQILRGYLEEDVDEVNAGAFPTSVTELQDTLTQENLSELNEQVAFRLDDGTLDDDGELTYEEDELDDAGFYTYAVATGDGLEVEDDDLSIAGETTIVGVEGVVAHDEPSTVDVDDDAEPGDAIDFDVDATAIDGDATHGVVLYEEEAFAGSTAVLNVTEEIDENLTAADVTIEHEIEAINGVQTIEGDVDLFGETLTEGNTSGTVAVADLIALVSEDVQSDVLGDGETLHASSTILPDGDPDEELTVQTFDNWTADDTEYRWIHTAVGSSSDEIQTNSGTITFDDDPDDGYVPSPPSPPTDPEPDKPEFQVTDASLSDTKIDAGDAVDVTATVAEQSGRTDGTFTAELVVDGEVVDERDVSVGAGEEETVTFTRSFDEPGEYEIEVSSVTAGTLTVGEKPPEEPGEPAFDVIDVSMSDVEIEVGDSVDVVATLENGGDASGTFTAELTIDGDVVDTRDVTLSAGETTTVTFTEGFDETGEYEIGVSGTSAGTLTVDDDSGLLPVSGFGTTVALVALLAVALLAARRQD